MNHSPIRRTVLKASSLLTLPMSVRNAWAQSGTLSIVVPFPAGGISDILARAMAPTLGKHLGRTVIVENLPGASGSIAARKLLASGVEGNMLMMGSPTDSILAPLTLKAVKYQASDFKLLGLAYTAPLAIYARADLPVSTVDELVAYANRPGSKGLNYGSVGAGSLFHIVSENLRKAAGFEATHIPYKGGAPLLQDLIGQNVDYTVMPVDNHLGGMVDSGKFKVLGVSTSSRSPRFPNAAMFNESKALAKFGSPGTWAGLMLPRAANESATALLHKAVVETLSNPEVRKTLEAAGATVPAPMSLSDAASFYTTESSKLNSMAKLANVNPN